MLESTTNRNPVFVVDNKMAIEAWAARILLCTASRQLVEFQKTPCVKFSAENAKQLQSITRAMLLVVADHMTAWNFRKQLVEQQHLNIKEDIALGDLILYKHRKTPETFAHRRWLLRQWLVDVRNDRQLSSLRSRGAQYLTSCSSSDSRTLGADNASQSYHILHSDMRHKAVRHELDVCTRTADRYSNNYHAWSHRLWVVESLACCLKETLVEELESLRQFVSRHVSDHSGLHYRQFLLNCFASLNGDLFQEGDYRSHLDSELALTDELNKLYPGHEAVWYHRRYVLDKLVSIPVCHSAISVSVPARSSSICDDDDDDYLDRPELRAAKKTKLTAAADGPSGLGDSCHPTLDEEMKKCRLLLTEQKVAALTWHKTQIERHLAWIQRLAARTSSKVHCLDA